ncbi:MAG TPA: histidine kinase [Puia sp.]|jgi:ligand-binding sensor domain-containing protein|nr:histidine kinase [Puia sp.]
MKSARLLSGLFLLSLSYSSFSQEYSYTHYDVSDGLAGSVVYCITQDRDGFIWTGTETGVSRFDGTHFKTFTAADGLPDIEVLEMFGDSKGRVWMAPFRKSVCYYYRGRIHNQDNDSLLQQIHLRENVENFAEDAAGNILILEKNALHWYGADGRVREIDSVGGQPVRDAAAVCRSASGQFLVQVGQQVYLLSEKGGALFYHFTIRDAVPSFIAMNADGVIWRTDTVQTNLHSFFGDKTVVLPFDRNYKHVSFTLAGDSLFYFNQLNGSIEYNVFTGETKKYLPGTEVSRTYRDAMGNTWFTTMGHGIYRLNSDEFRTIHMNAPGMEGSAIYAVRKIGERLYVGDNHFYIFSYSLPDMTPGQHYTSGDGAGRNRILFFGPMPDHRVIVGMDYGFCFIRGNEKLSKAQRLPMKTVFEKNSHELILSGAWGAGLYDMLQFRITDTLWNERSTTVFYRKDTTYIGTLNGLYKIGPDRSPTFMGNELPFLKKRISAIAESTDGTLWIASYDAGIVGYRDGRIVATINQQHGLTSDLCRTILMQENTLWVGTDKGLNKVALDKPGYPVIRYTLKDGLGSDIINCIYADSATIYVGTPAGLSYFDQTRVDVSQGCRLFLLSILNSGRDRIGDSAHLLVPFRDKHVRFEFAAISYRSVGDIVYRYRLLGLDSNWQEIRENFLEYPTIPSGNYVLQLQAINKFGVRSALLSMPFEVATPFWQTAWFDAMLIAVFLALVWLFVTLRISGIRKRQAEKEKLNQRLVELESTALQAQMNPHFIFNCLNSIQQYIFDHEALAANKYLTGFARLIRATLHHSSRTFMPLSDEIDYLSTYLSLEKLRFKEKMDYSITLDAPVDKDQFLVPPMLIQPFVENSMRHGLRHKSDGKGFIHIKFGMRAQKLIVIIEDNGIGRKKAAGYKTREHIEYQSKGMSLTADRIRTMNAKYGDSIHIEVIDLEDDAGKATGTRVILQFPLFHTTIQKEFL